MYYFTSVENCYMLEISPWFKKIAKTNNFSLLMSGKYSHNFIIIAIIFMHHITYIFFQHYLIIMIIASLDPRFYIV